MSQTFKKTIQNFTCAHCGFKVKGNGYTNHCPKCLWSKHVDINPGDRAEKCQGLMKPVDFTIEKSKYIVVQKCQKCAALRRFKMAENDNIDILKQLSETLVKKRLF